MWRHPLVLLRDIHSKLIDQYDCKEVCTSSPSQVNTGARVRLRSQDGVPQQHQTAPLSLPQINRQQILLHCQPFRDLKLKFIGSRRTEQLRLCSQQCIVATVEESVLRMEMTGLESQEEDTPKRFFSSSNR